MNDDFDEFQKLRQTSDKLVQVSKNLPGMSDSLLSELLVNRSEHELSEKDLESDLERIKSHSIAEYSALFVVMDHLLDQILQYKTNYSNEFSGWFEKISQSIHEIRAEVQKEISSTIRIIEASHLHATSRVNFNYHGLFETRMASLERLKNLANSVESTSMMLKEFIHSERISLSRSTSSRIDQYLLTAVSAYRWNNMEEAIKALERAYRLAPGNPVLICDLGMLYLECGRINDAEECLRKAMSIDEMSIQAHFLSAKIAIAQDRFSDAISILLDSETLTDNMFVKRKLLLETAFLYYQVGDIQSAEKTWQAVLLIIPFDDEARRWLKLINPG